MVVESSFQSCLLSDVAYLFKLASYAFVICIGNELHNAYEQFIMGAFGNHIVECHVIIGQG